METNFCLLQLFGSVQSIRMLSDVTVVFLSIFTVPVLSIYLFFFLSSGDVVDNKTAELMKLLSNHQKSDTVNKSASYLANSLIKFYFQINNFALQIMTQPINFKVLKVLKLNYELIFSLISISCSYFVVLMQFDMGV